MHDACYNIRESSRASYIMHDACYNIWKSSRMHVKKYFCVMSLLNHRTITSNVKDLIEVRDACLNTFTSGFAVNVMKYF